MAVTARVLEGMRQLRSLCTSRSCRIGAISDAVRRIEVYVYPKLQSNVLAYRLLETGQGSHVASAPRHPHIRPSSASDPSRRTSSEHLCGPRTGTWQRSMMIICTSSAQCHCIAALVSRDTYTRYMYRVHRAITTQYVSSACGCWHATA